MAGQCGDAARSASAAVLTSPDHLWSIFAALPAKYLVTACRVCRQWRDVERENEEALWRPLCSQLALLRGAKERQYESSARLARLSFKRQCRVLHSNLHSHIRQTRSPNTVLNNDYKFEVEVDNAGRNAFHGIAETRTVESNEVCLSVDCNAVDSPAAVRASDESLSLRVFVTRRCDNKVALLMELPLGAFVTGPSGQNVFVTATGFEVQDARSFLPASVVGHMETSWFIFFAAHISPDSKLQRVVLHLYCKASGLQASAFVDDTSPTQVTSGELLELLKHVDWA